MRTVITIGYHLLQFRGPKKRWRRVRQAKSVRPRTKPLAQRNQVSAYPRHPHSWVVVTELSRDGPPLYRECAHYIDGMTPKDGAQIMSLPPRELTD